MDVYILNNNLIRSLWNTNIILFTLWILLQRFQSFFFEIKLPSNVVMKQYSNITFTSMCRGFRFKKGENFGVCITIWFLLFFKHCSYHYITPQVFFSFSLVSFTPCSFIDAERIFDFYFYTFEAPFSPGSKNYNVF